MKLEYWVAVLDAGFGTLMDVVVHYRVAYLGAVAYRDGDRGTNVAAYLVESVADLGTCAADRVEAVAVP